MYIISLATVNIPKIWPSLGATWKELAAISTKFWCMNLSPANRFLFEIMHVFYWHYDYYYIVNKLFHDNLDIDIICHDIDNPII